MTLDLQPEQYYPDQLLQSAQIQNFSNNSDMQLKKSPNRPSINNIGHWTQKQNAQYYAFLKKFCHKFSQRQSRRQWKVFKALSKFIKTRNANQCRSHHHKMSKNFSSIKKTLEFLSKRQPELQLNYPSLSQSLQILQQTLFDDRGVESNCLSIKEQNEKGINSIPVTNYMNSLGRLQMKTQMEDKKIQNILTSVSYQDNENLKYYKTSNSLIAPSFRWVRSAGYRDLFYTNYQNLYSVNADNQYRLGVVVGMKSLEEVQYERKVMECHTSFLNWISKVNELINSSSWDYSQQNNNICYKQ